MTKITKSQINTATKALENSMHTTRRKLLELEVLQSSWEIQHGKGTIYDSADDLIEYIEKKLKSSKK